MTEVVITGLGAVTPLGDDVASTWAGLLAGTSAPRPIDAPWASELPVRFAAQVGLDVEAALGRVPSRRMDRVAQLAMVAAREAWTDAGFHFGTPGGGALPDDGLDRDRLGVAMGTGIGGLSTITTQWDVLHDTGARRVSPLTIPMLMANASAAQIGLAIGARARVQTAVSACASSNEALAQGLDELRLGRADVVLAGGADACVHPLPLAAFAQMQALSTRNDEPARASRPFDVHRDGFVLGEGAAMLVLETLAHARARGARIYGTLAGAGLSADSHALVQPDPSGAGQAAAMRRALADADLAACGLVHVNAHATSTPAGDLTEARAIRDALGAAADRAVVTAVKSQTGHLLGAAGALEAIATLLALGERIVPPTINLDEPEPGLPVDVATAPRTLPATGQLAGLNNSFGFGGHNVAVVLTTAHRTGGLALTRSEAPAG